MNVFVLCVGHTGSTTFHKACTHISNYTVGHETQTRISGPSRTAYPANHIEVDNRLLWFLDRLPDDAFYVHLTRDKQKIVNSFVSRYHHKSKGILRAWKKHVLCNTKDSLEDVAWDYVNTGMNTIDTFISRRRLTMMMDIDTITDVWPEFWTRIGAEGDYEKSIQEFSIHHNSTQDFLTRR